MGRSGDYGAVMKPQLQRSRRLFAAKNAAHGLLRLHAAVFLSAILISLSSSSAASAHPVSVTRTLVYVTRERIDVTIEVFLEDLYLFII